MIQPTVVVVCDIVNSGGDGTRSARLMIMQFINSSGVDNGNTNDSNVYICVIH